MQSHIKTENIGTSVSSISLGSDADPIFSSNYTAYRIIIDSTGTSTTYTNLTFRLRANTTDDTGTNYDISEMFKDDVNAFGSGYAGSQTSWRIGQIGNRSAIIVLDLMNPFVTTYTHFFSLTRNTGTASASRLMILQSGHHNQTTSYNGFTVAGPTMTGGKIRVYGYRD